VRCCGGLFATTSTARSKRDHASGCNSGSFFGSGFAMTEPDTKLAKMLAKMAADTKAIREGIVQITLAWAAVEGSMSLLLREVLGDASGEIAFAIYYSPASAEVRFKIVDAAFCELMGQSELKPAEFRVLMEPWMTLYGRLNNLKEFRNATAHGSISTFARFEKNYVRLMPPIFDFRRIVPSVRNRQIPGLSAHDVTVGATAIWEIIPKIGLFFPIARARRERDDATLQKTLAQAAASLTIPAPQPVARKQPKPHTQPRQSSAARRKAALARAAKKKP
jgi:hypothetical protein